MDRDELEKRIVDARINNPDGTSEFIDLSEVRSFASRRELRLDQYCGMWAAEPNRLMEMARRISEMDLVSHVESAQPMALSTVVEPTAEQIAIIDIAGTLTKGGSSFSSDGSMVRARRQIQNAARDPNIVGIMVRFDSPGGTVAGTADLANEIKRAAKDKPVHAFVEDMAASAAFWIASQADVVSANDATALIGSIGTYVVLYDMSGLAKAEGIVPIVISTGGVKGQTTPGLEISTEVKDHFQSIVDATQESFNDAIAAGRGLTAKQVEGLADGRVHPAPKAKSLGLIDGIMTFDEALSQLRQAVDERRTTQGRIQPAVTVPKEDTMAESIATAAPAAASYQDISAVCKGCESDPSWIVAQLARGANMEQARDAWIEHVMEREAAAEKRAAEAEERAEKAEKAKTAGLGHPPIGTRRRSAEGDPEDDTTNAEGDGEDVDEDTTNAVAAWNRAVRAGIARGENKRTVISRLVHERPKLHEAYIEAYNDSRGRRVS